MRESQRLIKETKKKFIFYSALGIGLVVLTAMLGLGFHEQSIHKQRNLQTANQLITEEYKLVTDIANLSEQLVDAKEKLRASLLKTQIKKLLSKLEVKEDDLNQFIANPDTRDVISSDSDDLSIRQAEVSQFISHVKNLLSIENQGIELAKSHAKLLSKSTRGNLGDSLLNLQSNLLTVLSNEASRLNRVALLLIIISVFQVVAVWFFVFRPLYKLISRQHEKLVSTLLEAKSANRSKTDFLANISHEIRTPMTAILGYANLVKKEEVSAEEKLNAVSIINNNANHLMGLIDEILDISKMESGKFEVEPEEVNLSKFLNEIYSLINVKAKEKNIDLIFSNRGPVPKTILIDPKRLKQILFNILGNAIKFTDEGYVEMNIHYFPDTYRLRFLVKDTGKGIEKKNLKKLFRPFEQVDTSVSRQYGGTGLGLVLSRDLARVMGGDVSIVKSKPDVGTVFEVSVDAGEVSGEKLIKNFSTSIVKPENYEPSEDLLKDKTVLVVDDAKENARLFEMYLRDAGAKVSVANDGQTAIDKVKRSYFDLVLLDLQMPGKDGFSVLKEIREDLDFEKPVVALTAHAMEEEKRKTKSAGFDAHITKPVEANDLVEQVSSLIS